MGRLRRFFLLALALLAIPLGLLIREALATAAEERARAHRSAAERLVDELERELTTWLELEEARPYGHYRHLYLPEGADAAAMAPSPLAAPPGEPFVLGYFQLEPDGRVTSPRWPRDLATATRLTGFTPDAEVRAEVDALATRVLGLWPPGSSDSPWDTPRDASLDAKEQRADWGGPAAKKVPTKGQLPVPGPEQAVGSQQAGSTIPLDPRSQKLLAKQEAAEGEPEAEDDASALGFLDQLNRGASSRQERPSKQVQSQLENYNQFSLEPLEPSVEPVPGRDSPPRRRDVRALSSSRMAESSAPAAEAGVADELADQAVDQTVGQALDWAADEEDRAEAVTTVEETEAAVEVRYEPIVGRATTGGPLVLYRTVIIAERAYRQGLLLDPDRLLAWLGSRVLADSELAERVELLPDTPRPRVPEGGQAFRHRFAEPFAGIAAVVVLAPLADPGGQQLTRLALVLTVAVLLALAALYRMVSVVVGFAERRSNFVSAVSHELKTPLTAIRMHGEMLRDGMVGSEEQRQRYYRILTGEAERLGRLVNNVLELSKLERRDRPVQIVAGDLAPVLDEVLELLAPHAEQKGFALRVELEEGLPAVRFDRDALVQVLFNLVDNALKYGGGADGERPEVVLAARRVQRGVEVAVIDHGPGVERRHLEKIFEPFYRAENELTRRAQGTGIGLALVRGLVERMGGSVRGRNRPEGGFEVTVALSPAAARG